MNKVVDFIKKYKESNPSGWRKWIIGSIVVVLTLVVVAGFAISAALRGRELARLKHERDVAKEEVHRAQVNMTLAKQKEEAERHEAAADQARARAEEIEEQIKVLQEEHSASESLIDSIRSWDDVDRLVK